MLADYHIHTSFSSDSECPMAAMLQKAVDLGLEEVCITEHVDYFARGASHLCDYSAYIEEIERLKIKFKDQIIIKCGMEFGVQLGVLERYERDVARYDFDFVILSNHQVADLEFWNNGYQKGKTQQEYNRGYYQAIKDVMDCYKSYSVLGHLDMIKRYDAAGILADAYNEDIIKCILKTAIADGKGIEVNTSCFRYGLPGLTPSYQILNWYYEAGGRIITIGSDSHQACDVGDHIRYAQEELKKIGFTEFATFDKMKPVFHPLKQAVIP